MGRVVITVADYIIKFIEEKLEATHVFLLAGGGNMFLLDSVRRSKLFPVCNHHEQACAMGAIGYTKQTGKPGVVIPTTGCGGTNTITGLLDAWQDSLPCFFISGQVNSNQMCRSVPGKPRKLGVQEVDIVELVKPITKYAVILEDALSVKRVLERAYFESTTGRPGPVWIDVPLDIQNQMIDPDGLVGFEAPKRTFPSVYNFDYLKESKRPVLLIGNGVKVGKAEEELRLVVDHLQIPIVSTFLATDLVGDHPLYTGRIGIKGDRAGNFALQNADLVIAIGTSLAIPMTGFIYEYFARDAELVVVDIDPEEHKKETVKIDRFIESDAKWYLNKLFWVNYKTPLDWKIKCRDWKVKWKVDPDVKPNAHVDLYKFTNILSKLLPKNWTVVGDAGSAYYVPCQNLTLSKGQKLVVPGAQAEMGFTIPACIGVQFGKEEGETVGITGDGSFQLNVQELQTIAYYDLPIKLFVWNNNGYLSIRNTQNKYFNGKYIGTSHDSGISMPNVSKIAYAYGIPYTRIDCNGGIELGIQDCLEKTGPVICEVMCDEEQEIYPAISAIQKDDGSIIGRPLEDMAPLLSREEFHENMIIEPIT